MARPPSRIETERLVIRCWEPRDAPLLKDAIDTSLEHLRPWMPWAHEEPQSLEEKVDLLRDFRRHFEAGDNFVYGVFSTGEEQALGGTGLHTRAGDDAFEIGYWIRRSAIGNGLATEAAATLTHVAFTVCKVDRVEIHVDPRNEASCRIPRKLGYVEEGRLRRRLLPLVPGGPKRDALIFSMLVEEFGGSPAEAGSAVVAAFDDVGEKVL